jgi:hypothetical protein
MKKWKFLVLQWLELLPLGRPASSQLLYRLHYRGPVAREGSGIFQRMSTFTCTEREEKPRKIPVGVTGDNANIESGICLERYRYANLLPGNFGWAFSTPICPAEYLWSVPLSSISYNNRTFHTMGFPDRKILIWHFKRVTTTSLQIQFQYCNTYAHEKTPIFVYETVCVFSKVEINFSGVNQMIFLDQELKNLCLSWHEIFEGAFFV